MIKVYCGTLKHLIGETAEIRKATHGYVVAQFDNINLTRSGLPIDVDLKEGVSKLPIDALGYGWHAFHEDEFKDIS